MVDIPPLHEFWDQPTPKDRGNNSQNVIFEAVGYALTIWEMLEVTLAQLFTMLVESQSNAASRAYGILGSLTARKDVLINAGETFHIIHNVSQKHRDEFDLLMKHINSASGKRNEIAHGYVIGVNHNADDLGYFLTPPHYSTKKTKASITIEDITSNGVFAMMPGKYRYTKEDIDHYREKFLLLKVYTYQVINTVSSYLQKLQQQPQGSQSEPPQQEEWLL